MDFVELEKILKVKNYTEEQIAEIKTAMDENKIYLTATEGADDKIAELNGTVTELNGKIEESNGKETDAGAKDAEIASLKKELADQKIVTQVKDAVTAAGGKDADYILFKMRQKGELELTEDGKVKDLDNLMTSVKEEVPEQFAKATDTETKPAGVEVDVKKWNESHDNTEKEPENLAEAIADHYSKGESEE